MNEGNKITEENPQFGVELRVIQPFYNADGICLYNCEWEQIINSIEPCNFTFIDPPYGENKAEWDAKFTTEYLEAASSKTLGMIAITPGISNLLKLPETFGEHEYVWEHTTWIKNGMTRSKIGFGNHISTLLYQRKGVSAYKQEQDFDKITVNGDKPPHPSPKPIDYMKYLITRFTKEDDIILDLFCGSGTTLLAAKELGRKAVGIERELEYCEYIVGRLSQTTMQFNCKDV